MELPAGVVEQPSEFSYTALDVESAPARLEGFTLTGKVFDLSLVGTSGLVTLGQPITVMVSIDTRDVALAGGDESRIVVQHYHEDDGWEVLETTVDFASSVASAQVERLSVFALAIKEPEPPPALAVVATQVPAPTAIPAPPPMPVPAGTPTALPTSTPIPSPSPEPTSTPILAVPVPTAVPVIVPTVVVQPTPTATPAPTETPIPTATLEPTPTLVPTPTRPRVNGYLLGVNGSTWGRVRWGFPLPTVR